MTAIVLLQAVDSAPTTVDMAHKPELLKIQLNDLQTLGCKPMLQKVVLADHIKVRDDLADKMFFPQVAAINRCIEKCSFCGIHFIGMDKGHCLPDPEGVKKRKIIVFYVEGGKKHFRELEVIEHTSCKCT
ncbi:hypothetical protein Hamer_G007546 [Homarus americanus]|uniref:Platelet-derived growth factor (PDGF) family profile domain-containing protein n=1 Tax=Homarus americanus TaxID=6706 RepID=A0A8J5JPX2_HOMAM|nr:hypothetical protein Hamer_G007546 [Homarus americanus]